MPFYEYTCPECMTRFEVQRTMDHRDDPTECPECGTKASRMLSMPAIFTRSGNGDLRVLSNGPSCGSCSATSCGSCSVKN